MEQFKKTFINEAENLVINLEEDLLELENNSGNKELIEEVFRVMHTLKGTSSMYGFDEISTLTHLLENIYDLIRDRKLVVSKPILDITLQAGDHIRNILSDENLDDPKNKETQKQLIHSITSFLTDSGHRIEHSPETFRTGEKEHKSAHKGMATYCILFTPTEELFLRGIKIVSIFKDLNELGRYEIVKPWSSKYEADENGSQFIWEIYLATAEPFEDIEDAFLFVIDECKIVKLSEGNLFEKDEFLNQIHQNLNIKEWDKIENVILDDVDLEGLKQFEEKLSLQNGASEDKGEVNNDRKASNKTISEIGKQITSRIYVDSEKLDYLMYLVSELVTTKAQLMLATDNRDYAKLNEAAEMIDKLSNQFRDNALSIRLVPVADMVIRFKRLIRDLSHELHKDVKFTTKGMEVELDKNIIDNLAEPIMHIIRNCLDHGIELPDERIAQGKPPQGEISIAAYQSGAGITIQIEDDGAGIDTERIKEKAIEKKLIKPNAVLTEKEILDLIFLPGFSTAKFVSSVSGRGVGMDVVKKKIAEIRGDIELETRKGKGTRFTIKLQQTITIIDTLLVKINKTHFCVPMSDIEVCESQLHNKLFDSMNRQFEFDDTLVPFLYLRDQFPQPVPPPQFEKLIIINKNGKRFAVVADKIIGEHQAVLKPLSNFLDKQDYLSGASILGDGSLALVIDTNRLSAQFSK